MRRFNNALKVLLPLALLFLQPVHVHAQDVKDPEKAAIAQQLHMAAQTLRELINPTAKRIENAAREMARRGPLALDALIDLTTDPVAAVRRSALRALAHLGSRSVLPALVQALADKEPLVVVDAANALGPIQGDWPTRALVRYLGHPDRRVCVAVEAALRNRPGEVIQATVRKLIVSPPPDIGKGPYLTALGRFPDKDTLNELITSLDDSRIGPYAVRGLGYFGAQAAPRAVAWMITRGQNQLNVAAGLAEVLAAYPGVGKISIGEVLARGPLGVQRVTVQGQAKVLGSKAGPWVTDMTGHKVGGVRIAALEIVPSVPGADPVRFLKSNLNHASRPVRMLAARALMNHRRDPIAQEHTIKRYRKLTRKRSSATLEERDGLMRAMGRIGNQEAVAELIHALGNTDETPSAIAGLSDLGKRGVRSLLFVVKTDDNIRAPRALRALARLGEAALSPMLRLLVHPNMEVRNIARRALASMGATKAVPTVVKLIDKPKTPGRVQLIALLGHLPSKPSLDALTRLASKSNNKTIRLAAVKALAQMPYDQVRGVLRYLASKDANNEVRLWAVQSLIGRADRKSVPLFKKMLAYEKPFIRQACAFGIGYLGKPSDIPAVAKYMADPRPTVLSSVRDTLRRLSYQPKLRYEEQFEDWLDDYKDVKPPKKVPFKRLTMPILELGEIAYWLGGRGGKKPLLVLHGGPDLDHRYLKLGYDALTQNHLLMYVDLPGRGASKLRDWPPMGFDADARAIAVLLAKLNLRKVDILAHGWGAHIAVTLAERYPKMVDRLILDNPVGPSFKMWLQDYAETRAKAPEPWASDITLLAKPLPLFTPTVRDRYTTVAMMTSRLATPSQMVDLVDHLHLDRDFRQLQIEAVGVFSLKERYTKLTHPTLIIQGAKNPISDLSKAFWKGLEKSNKKVTMTRISKAGFLPAYEQPKPFRNAIKSYLKR